MDGLVRAQVEAVHGSGARLALCVTGGGARAVSWLVGVAGASRSILEVQIPYSGSALEEYLGERVESAVAPEVAAEMARVARLRAERLAVARRRGRGHWVHGWHRNRQAQARGAPVLRCCLLRGRHDHLRPALR